MAEQRTHKPSVVGSSPTLATQKQSVTGCFFIFAPVSRVSIPPGIIAPSSWLRYDDNCID